MSLGDIGHGNETRCFSRTICRRTGRAPQVPGSPGIRTYDQNAEVLASRPPASQNANLAPLVEGQAISLAARHAKVRREGYAK